MKRRGPERSEGGGEQSAAFTFVRDKRTTQKLPLLEGLPAVGEDPTITLAVINTIFELRRQGKAPHNGRERRANGESDPQRPHRRLGRRRGTWNS